MQKLPFGRTGHESSRVIFGAAALGRMRQEKADALLDLLLAHGVNHIDTAAAYGESELRVGAWMRSHRDRFFLATKTGERTYEVAKAQFALSLERLQTDHVDLLQLHNLVDPAEWETALRLSLGPFEGVLVASACRSAGAGNLADSDHAQKPDRSLTDPSSTRRASREMGEQLLGLGMTWAWAAPALQQLGVHDANGWHHPVSFGLLGSVAAGLPAEVLTAYLHQAALGMIGAGVRAIPVGHTHGQQVLAYLHDDLGELVTSLVDGAPQPAGAGCPYYEVLCDEQTQLYARMFRS